ncbi:MAG: 2-hydroxyacyl-CoA dehydratase family protein [Deltaproteobacteria bacterium]|nr:2-hydroxyacyl-CoA dehydratase family protein [Deltaproteobacteria bacterium]
MFKPFHNVVTNVSKTIGKYEAELNRPVIGVMPAYFPMELIDAAGGYPVQLWGNNLSLENSDAYLQSYCCSVARSVLELELRGIAKMVKAYAFTSLCDTLINLREIYRNIFSKPTVELSIPITRTAEARNNYLESVVQSVVVGLEAITGQKMTPENLQQASKRFGRLRALQRRLYRIRHENPGLVKNHDFYTVIKSAFFLPADIYNRMLEDLLTDLDKLKSDDNNRPKLLLSGMVFDPLEVYRIFDESGVCIVDDDFANGWRTVAKHDLKTENLAQGITEYLFNPVPCCCIYNPENDRHTYMLKKVKESGADGVLFWYIKFCEPDAFDQPQLMKRLKDEGIPVASIDLELTMNKFDQLKTRINAFCEILDSR